jgi:hypothetical protein
MRFASASKSSAVSSRDSHVTGLAARAANARYQAASSRKRGGRREIAVTVDMDSNAIFGNAELGDKTAQNDRVDLVEIKAANILKLERVTAAKRFQGCACVSTETECDASAVDRIHRVPLARWAGEFHEWFAGINGRVSRKDSAASPVTLAALKDSRAGAIAEEIHRQPGTTLRVRLPMPKILRGRVGRDNENRA